MPILTPYQYTTKFGKVFDLSYLLDAGFTKDQIAARARKFQREQDLFSAIDAMRNAGETPELIKYLKDYLNGRGVGY